MFKDFDLSKTGLKRETIDQIQNCLSRFPEIDKAVLYGSRAKGTFRRGSDIDLSLLGKKIGSSVISKLDIALDDLMLPYTFDISIYAQIDNDHFKEHIDRVGMIFFEQKPNG